MRTWITCVVAFAVTTLGYAQMEHEVGAKAGYTHLFVSYDDPFTPVNGVSTSELNGGGFSLGAYYNYTPFDDVFIQAELLFSNRMWNEVSTNVFDGQVSTTSQTYTHYVNNYIELPLLAKYGINMSKRKYGDKKYLFFYGGVSTHMLLSTKGTQQETFRVDAVGQTTVTQTESTIDRGYLKEYFNPFQIGALGGIQYTFGFGLNVDVRYQFLMNPVTRVTPEMSQAGDFSVLKHGMAQFTIGYNFLSNY